MGQLNPPATIAQFKHQFFRDFVYGEGLDSVTDKDIQNGLNMTDGVFNPRLFSTAPIGIPPNITNEALIAYLNCSAHFVVMSIQGVGGLNKKNGGLNSQAEGLVSNKSVGGVSVGFVWPSFITENPALYSLTKTVYGQEYLQVLSTRLVGNVSFAFGEMTGIPNVPFF